ncbi:ATP-binding protein [Tsukamurella sp. 8F]|uniref:sacsin N-terminal ATP-binding-like domain-containing protein n=1 Tax=unclassified Tsukamurella TaxID=2633480 RepID=UPI0023B8D7D0|nr:MULTISPECIES: ATP-binding protein [unclassified Tsukamurella]MDF0529826.1 ATP-binding protein [Tsukamurella sp. 8J]MDF0587018.1 ATP-binding protein [Tsukamurella sp. 8F]
MTPTAPREPSVADPFDTAGLRAGVLAAWRDSPTRLREDLATERDLVDVGYRERVVVELLQNAADAARTAGVPGRVAVWADGDGVHIANTGAALTLQGVHSLAAQRVSAKESRDSVGRFGVGFRAVLTVASEIEFRSAGGGVAFSAARSAELAGGEAPVLRLPFQVATPPADGFDSEIVLADAAAGLVRRFAEEAEDTLIDLPALESVVVDGAAYRRPALVEGAGPHARWIRGADAAVLHAPTRTDEPLTLPVRVVTDLPVTADRRRLHPDADIAMAARGYADFVAAQPDPLAMLPPRRPPAGPVDAALREAIEGDLRSGTWLPGSRRPDRSVLVPGVTQELYELLEDSLPLLPPDLSRPSDVPVLQALGVAVLGAADIADAVPRDRDPAWYGRLYDALDGAGMDAGELGALPVPLADGRVVTGARGALSITDLPDGAPGPSWARVVHFGARHPLLERAGARTATVVDLLSDPALERELDEIDYDTDDPDSALGLTESVLALVGDRLLDLPAGLGALAVPAGGELVPADEALLPDAPLRAALTDDHPYAAVDPEWAACHSVEALRSIGVGWTFGVLREDFPTGPDDGLPDADEWWHTLMQEPERLVAVRDLDLVDHWEPALALIAELPGVLDDPAGYTAWWLRRHTELGGLRPPDDERFAGLLDPCRHPDAARLQNALFTGVVDDGSAQLLLDALSDPGRSPSPGEVVAAYRELAGWSVDVPARLRTVRGDLAEDPVVLDAPQWRFVLDDFVFGGLAAATDLAETLGLDCASEAVGAEVVSTGTRVRAAADPGVTVAAALGALPAASEAVLHERLEVDAGDGPIAVPWWVDTDGALHVSGRDRAV